MTVRTRLLNVHHCEVVGLAKFGSLLKEPPAPKKVGVAGLGGMKDDECHRMEHVAASNKRPKTPEALSQRMCQGAC